MLNRASWLLEVVYVESRQGHRARAQHARSTKPAANILYVAGSGTTLYSMLSMPAIRALSARASKRQAISRAATSRSSIAQPSVM